MTYYLIVAIIISYLIGSFSTAYWFGKWFFKLDIRKVGSKNAGATNTMRVLGYKAALPVFIIDIFKSFLAIQLIYFIPEIQVSSEFYYLVKIILGASAVIGHIFPLYSKFDGGKGVASLLGVILALHLIGTLIVLGMFIIVFLIFRIVSISSLIAAISFPITIYIMENSEKQILIVFSIIATMLLVITHLKNIKRLIKGEEKRIDFKK